MPKDPRQFEAERKNFGEEIITLVVGEEGRKFLVHKELLCQNSAFFQAAVHEQWKEGQEHMITLPSDEADVLDLYTHWIYRERIYSRKSIDSSGKTSTERSNLVRAFVFGEKIQDGPFKDAIIDALIASVSTPDKDGETWFPTAKTVYTAYTGTPESSPIRRLMLDWHIRYGHAEWVDASSGTDFLVDLAKELYSSQRPHAGPDPTGTNISSCSYHHHSKEQECYSKRYDKV